MPKSKKRQKTPNRKTQIAKNMRMIERLNAFVANRIRKLEAENEKLKTDPESVVGQLVPQMREAISQNKRLSVLVAALLEAQGGSIKLTKDNLEAFESKVLNIKWELPEGVETVEDSAEFIFTYEALTQEEAATRAAQITVSTTNDDEQSTSVDIIPASEPSVEMEEGIDTTLNSEL